MRHLNWAQHHKIAHTHFGTMDAVGVHHRRPTFHQPRLCSCGSGKIQDTIMIKRYVRKRIEKHVNPEEVDEARHFHEWIFSVTVKRSWIKRSTIANHFVVTRLSRLGQRWNAFNCWPFFFDDPDIFRNFFEVSLVFGVKRQTFIGQFFFNLFCFYFYFLFFFYQPSLGGVGATILAGPPALAPLLLSGLTLAGISGAGWRADG